MMGSGKRTSSSSTSTGSGGLAPIIGLSLFVVAALLVNYLVFYQRVTFLDAAISNANIDAEYSVARARELQRLIESQQDEIESLQVALESSKNERVELEKRLEHARVDAIKRQANAPIERPAPPKAPEISSPTQSHSQPQSSLDSSLFDPTIGGFGSPIVQTSADIFARDFGLSQGERWCDARIGFEKIRSLRRGIRDYCNNGASNVVCTHQEQEYYCKCVRTLGANQDML